MAFNNRPNMQNENGENTIRRFVHSPLTIEHFGINASITANGRVIISKVARVVGEDVEYDEVEIPASLVFKLASLLKATRKVEYVGLASNQATPADEKAAPEKGVAEKVGG